MRDYFSQLFDTSELLSVSKVMDFGEEPTEYLSSCPQIRLFLIIHQEKLLCAAKESITENYKWSKYIVVENTPNWYIYKTQPLLLRLRIAEEKRLIDFKSQRNRDVSMRLCLLDMLAPPHIKYHQHGCLYMNSTRVTTIHTLTWKDESLQGLNTGQRSTGN